MFWNELEGTTLLGKVFSEPVSIDAVDVFDVVINRDGPSVHIHFDLIDKLPDTPPEKWGNFNKCRCGINCSEVSELIINNVQRTMKCKVKIHFNNKYMVNMENENMKISFCCEYINFTGPSVYLS